MGGKKRGPKALYGLRRNAQPKIHREYCDQDYADKLSDADKEWLSRFNEEYLHSRFENDGKDHYQSVEDRRRLYNESNARRRDVLGIMRVKGTLQSLQAPAGRPGTGEPGIALEEVYGAPGGSYSEEDAIIARLDGFVPEEEDA